MSKKTFKNILQISALVFILVCLFSLLYNPAIAGDGTYTLLEPLPVPGGTMIKETDGIGVYLQGGFKLGIGLATVLAVLMITIGGLQLMTSDKVQLRADAKTTITNALWGLVLILASFLLLKTVNPDLIKSSLDLKPVAAPTPAPPASVKDAWEGDCLMYKKDGTYFTTMSAYGDTPAECAALCQKKCKFSSTCNSATDTCKPKAK